MTRSFAAAVIFLFLTFTLGGCSPLTFTIGGNPGGAMQPTVVQSDGEWFGDRIAIVDVSGLIVNGSSGFLGSGDNPVSLLHEKLEAARRDSRVKGVILRLNSPGGGVTASDVMYREVMRFKKETGKPVVALLMDVAASGGYYLACSADKIVAYPTSVTGSIGVIVQTISIKPALTRWGIDAEAITSGPNKETGSPLTTMTPSQRAVLRSLVDDFYARFVGLVKQSRPNIPADKLAEVTDGRVVSGRQAVELGLADSTGDLHDAHALVMQLAGISHSSLIEYRRPMEYVGSPYARAPGNAPTAGGTQINLAQINFDESLSDLTAGFYYLWRPGLPLGDPKP